EGTGADPEHREYQRQRHHHAFPAGERAEAPKLLAGGLGDDVDAGLSAVEAGDAFEPGAAAAEEADEEFGKLSVDRVVRLVELAADHRLEAHDEGPERGDGPLDILHLRAQRLSALRHLPVFLDRQKIDRPQRRDEPAQRLDPPERLVTVLTLGDRAHGAVERDAKLLLHAPARAPQFRLDLRLPDLGSVHLLIEGCRPLEGLTVTRLGLSQRGGEPGPLVLERRLGRPEAGTLGLDRLDPGTAGLALSVELL